jgi:hypothetical protein
VKSLEKLGIPGTKQKSVEKHLRNSRAARGVFSKTSRKILVREAAGFDK